MTTRFESPIGIFATLRNLHRGEASILPRVILSLAAGLLLTAAAFLSALFYALLMNNWGMGFLRVPDEYFAIAFAFCGAGWLASLVWIWRGMKNSKPLIPPALYTFSLWFVTAVALVGIEQATRSMAEEILMTATCCVSGAITLLIWLPTIQRLRIGRPVLDGENLVNVHCPECGYSLIGLRELRCPECGARFTIDELIRRQEYTAARVLGEGVGGQGETKPTQCAPQSTEAAERT